MKLYACANCSICNFPHGVMCVKLKSILQESLWRYSSCKLFLCISHFFTDSLTCVFSTVKVFGLYFSLYPHFIPRLSPCPKTRGNCPQFAPLVLKIPAMDGFYVPSIILFTRQQHYPHSSAVFTILLSFSSIRYNIAFSSGHSHVLVASIRYLTAPLLGIHE